MPPPFRELFPELPDAELAAAQERFDQYLTLAVRIFSRLEREAAECERADSLTALAVRATVKGQAELPPPQAPHLPES